MLNKGNSKSDLNYADFSAATIAPATRPDLSDDECLMRLARAIEEQNSEKFDELAMLIGRLAVTIE